MYKTTWFITDKTDGITSNFTYYHFGKEPQFPSWYMEENHEYLIEMLWNDKLITTIQTFLKCLCHHYCVK